MSRNVFLSMTLFILPLVGVAPGQIGRKFTVSSIKCENVSCATREGWQPGLTTLELEATGWQAYSAYALRLRLILVGSPGRAEVVEDRRIGVMSNGKFTATISAFKHPDGRYRFVVTPVSDDRKTLARGEYVKGQGAATLPDEPERARPDAGGLAGTWRGTNGTAGEVRIFADGSYTFNGAKGTCRVANPNVVFSGPLSSWNGGKAHLNKGVIEFYWTTPEGWKQWFTFQKIQ